MSVIIVPILTSGGREGLPEWLSRLAARVQRMIARLAVAVRQAAMDTITSTNRWRADPALPIERALTSRQITDCGVISRVHIPARPPAPMPWHEAL